MAELLEPFARDRAENAALQLIDRFGSLQATLTASPEQIAMACAPDRELAAMIIGARRLVESALREHVVRSVVRVDDPQLHRHLILKFHGRPHEELHAIFMDCQGHFLREELVSTGSSDRVEAKFRPILRRAINLDAAGVVLVHNHPSRSPEPSASDVTATKRFAELATAVELALVDHLIVAGKTITSMRERGLLA